MKKTKKILLVVMLMLAFIINTSAVVFAANNGPAKVPYAFINVSEEAADFGGRVYENYETYNDLVEGVTYDKDSNTLTLENVDGKNIIGINMMGDDFKLKVVGENNITAIVVWGDAYSANLTITGDGTLNVNKDKTFESAIRVIAEGTDPVITIDKTVNVKLYAEESVINIMEATNGTYNPIVLKNGEKIDVKKEEIINIRNEFTTKSIAVASMLENEEECENVYKKGNDIYSVETVNIVINPEDDYSEWETEERYEIHKIITDKKTGLCFEDPTFGEYGWGYERMTKEEFAKAGYTKYNSKVSINSEVDAKAIGIYTEIVKMYNM